ncbi:type II toxin-antitoxin system RelE/ParE family toxin [Zoogloea sp.]|uniref:type II toxin-antitoxin system RelE/ParE family toxin n=1 Tax=Zoogloea sp. TaxID=49181 RepID=UPI0035B2C8EF
MNTFLRTDEFDAWLAGLNDNVARARIVHRIRSAQHGNFGDCEPVGEGVSEMRIHVGPGYRAYYTRRGAVIYLSCSEGISRRKSATLSAPSRWRGSWTRSERCLRPPPLTLPTT